MVEAAVKEVGGHGSRRSFSDIDRAGDVRGGRRGGEWDRVGGDPERQHGQDHRVLPEDRHADDASHRLPDADVHFNREHVVLAGERDALEGRVAGEHRVQRQRRRSLQRLDVRRETREHQRCSDERYVLGCHGVEGRSRDAGSSRSPRSPGAPGAPGPAGPAGPKAVASTSQTIVGGVVNWIPISASFVAAADGSCLVTTSVAPFLTTLPAPPAGQTVAGIGGGVSVNGAPFVTDNTSGLWSTGVGGAYTAPVTVTSYFTIAAGQTYQFGAWYNPHATNGQLATAKQGYVCS